MALVCTITLWHHPPASTSVGRRPLDRLNWMYTPPLWRSMRKMPGAQLRVEWGKKSRRGFQQLPSTGQPVDSMGICWENLAQGLMHQNVITIFIMNLAVQKWLSSMIPAMSTHRIYRICIYIYIFMYTYIYCIDIWIIRIILLMVHLSKLCFLDP